MSLAITILGSSGMFQTLERACAGYLLHIDDHRIWLDAGAGTWLNLQRHLDYADIDGVLLTHAHPDHTTDVLQAYHARQYGQDEPLDVIPMWGPQSTLDRISAYSRGIEDAFELRPIDSNADLQLGSTRLTFVDMAHPEPTLGVRVSQNGVVAAFSSDTGVGADFDALASSADVFVCEATSQESDALWEGHLRASQAAEIAARVGVKKLVLTHLRPGRDHQQTLAEARGAAPGLDIELAQDGARLEVS